MKHFYFYGSLAMGLALVGCVDEDYDLSDIDTTVRVSVDNLVVPIDIDQIELKAVLDIDDDDEYVKVIDGAYCYVTDGDFSSDEISIPMIAVKVPNINPVSLSVSNGQSAAITIPSGGMDVCVPLVASTVSTFSLNANYIDESIVSIDHVGVDMSLTLSLECTMLKSAASRLTLTGMQIQLPAGLVSSSTTHGTYDTATGILAIPEIVCETSQATKIQMQFNGINVGDKFNASQHSFDFSTMVGILAEGSLSIVAADMYDGATLPSNIELGLGFAASDFVATSYTGQICYKIDDIPVPDISLEDLPDVIAQNGSNLVLSNPQLYIQANNPLNDYGLVATTGMVIQAMRGEGSTRFSPDHDITFSSGSSGLCNILLAPQNAGNPDAEFATDLSYVKFSTLGSILSGDGVPDALKINLVDPQVPTQQVNGFQLSQSYDGVNGRYKFIAPLQFEAGSTICYRDTVDGWSSEDLEAITITDLTVNFNVTTDVPVSVSLTGYPINENGKQINNVTINGAEIPANAKNQSVSITISGYISNLDGIVFEANATVVGGGALSPNMTVTLSDIRPSVTGYYEKEL